MTLRTLTSALLAAATLCGQQALNPAKLMQRRRLAEYHCDYSGRDSARCRINSRTHFAALAWIIDVAWAASATPLEINGSCTSRPGHGGHWRSHRLERGTQCIERRRHIRHRGVRFRKLLYFLTRMHLRFDEQSRRMIAAQVDLRSRQFYTDRCAAGRENHSCGVLRRSVARLFDSSIRDATCMRWFAVSRKGDPGSERGERIAMKHGGG